LKHLLETKLLGPTFMFSKNKSPYLTHLTVLKVKQRRTKVMPFPGTALILLKDRLLQSGLL